MSAADGVRRFAWIPAAAGGALLVGGGVFYGLASSQASRLENDPQSIDSVAEAQRVRSTGESQQQLAFILAGAGVAALATGAALYFLGAPEEAPATVAPVAFADGGGVSFSVRLP